MPIIGTNLGQSIAGAPAQRVAPKGGDSKSPAGAVKRRDSDELITDPRGVEGAEALRSLKSNDQEESHEDRQEHAAYTQGGKVKKKDSPRIDVAG